MLQEVGVLRRDSWVAGVAVLLELIAVIGVVEGRKDAVVINALRAHEPCVVIVPVTEDFVFLVDEVLLAHLTAVIYVNARAVVLL